MHDKRGGVKERVRWGGDQGKDVNKVTWGSPESLQTMFASALIVQGPVEPSGLDLAAGWKGSRQRRVLGH